MISSIVLFILVFAALGLLLGFAASFETQPQQQERTVESLGTNSTATSMEEQTGVAIEENAG